MDDVVSDRGGPEVMGKDLRKLIKDGVESGVSLSGGQDLCCGNLARCSGEDDLTRLDERAVLNVDEEAKVSEEVRPNEGPGDVGLDDRPCI